MLALWAVHPSELHFAIWWNQELPIKKIFNRKNLVWNSETSRSRHLSQSLKVSILTDYLCHPPFKIIPRTAGSESFQSKLIYNSKSLPKAIRTFKLYRSHSMVLSCHEIELQSIYSCKINIKKQISSNVADRAVKEKTGEGGWDQAYLLNVHREKLRYRVTLPTIFLQDENEMTNGFQRKVCCGKHGPNGRVAWE